MGIHMPTDYAEIKRDNMTRYGTEIRRIGQILLADSYADRTHFIFELLQNAEDALERRENHSGSRSVSFDLFGKRLEVSHFGQPFDEADVRGISDIGKSTKAEGFSTIGRFGIGFKAVYAFSESPEIHSGEEHFAIDSFVWPHSITPIPMEPGQTRFIFPFRADDPTAYPAIAVALGKLDVRTLLFLREIDEIGWSIDKGNNGIY